MGIVAIYRKAKKDQKSSHNHLYQTQDTINQDPKQNQYIDEVNTLWTFDPEKGKLVSRDFVRNGSNHDIVEMIKNREDDLFINAKNDYRTHKLKERELNPKKKIRTELQSKDLNKEFGIFFGNNEIDNNGNEIKLTRTQQLQVLPDLDSRILKGVVAILKKKNLTIKDNLVSINIHRDEANLIHAHIVYNEYSHKFHTTANQLSKNEVKPMANETKENFTKRAKEAYLQHKEDFGEFQTVLAKTMGLERGKVKSGRKHVANIEYKKQQRSLELKKSFDNTVIELQTQYINKEANLQRNFENKFNELNKTIINQQQTKTELTNIISKLDIEVANNQHRIEEQNRTLIYKNAFNGFMEIINNIKLPIIKQLLTVIFSTAKSVLNIDLSKYPAFNNLVVWVDKEIKSQFSKIKDAENITQQNTIIKNYKPKYRNIEEITL